MTPKVMPASALVAHFEADDPEGVLAALSELSDETRAEVWEVLRRPLTAVLGPDDRRRFTVEGWMQHIRTRALVALAVGPTDLVRQVGSWVFLESRSDVDRVLTSRTPEWRGEFIVSTLRTFASEREVGLMGRVWWVWWQQVRHWERSGVLGLEPTAADYLVVMVRGLLFSGSIVDALNADPKLTERSVWSLFEPAPGVQKALLGAERFWDPSNTWRVALVRLALAGVLDGEQLASAAAVAAGDERMGRNHRAWYRKIPELLADPSLLPEPPEHGPPPAGNQMYRLG